jgi:exopolysaccharide biosynthesis protein
MNCVFNYPRSICVAGMLLLVGPTFGGMAHTGWSPMFKGIEHATGTNTPTATYPNLNVIHAMRVDLQDPDLQLFTSPRISNYSQDSRETAGYTVSDFLKRNHLQLAVNANLFDPQDYYLPAGTPMEIFGLSICRGDVVSPQENRAHSAALMFTSNNVPDIVYTNWPARSNNGIYTAVSGDYCVLVKGVNTGYQYRNSSDPIHDTNPRTAFGLSQDKRYFFILTIDGRQPGYSVGALDFETAAWLLLLGAYDGVDMDGGGSTTLVVQNSIGAAVRLNRSSAVADSGKERTVGSHFGIFAKPVPAFINDVTAIPDDRAAVINWTTTAPATGRVDYGTTTNFTDTSLFEPDLTTNHSVTLSGLTPDTTYYYQVESGTNAVPILSPIFTFVTTNYVTTNVLFALTNAWKYTTADLDGQNWPAPEYDDSGWSGPGPGILWSDARGPNSAIDQLQTSMPLDPATGFPYPAYYFRTSFSLTNVDPGIALYVSAFVDDGAAFYLNGTEVYRLRMPDAPTIISYTDLSASYGCNGDATCPDDFRLPGQIAENLRMGENMLAVEVHNYNAKSPDITFGASLTATVPVPRAPAVTITYAGGNATVSWAGSGFTLQEADNLAGPWQNVAGSSVSSPWSIVTSAQVHYYRLRK